MTIRNQILKTTMGAAMALASGAANAADFTGLWRTEPGDDGSYLVVEIDNCGEEICGTIHSAVDKNGKKIPNYQHSGKRMIWGMKETAPNKYSGGKIWAPDRDKTYNSKMAINENSMDVEGCVFVICRAQTWSRAE